MWTTRKALLAVAAAGTVLVQNVPIWADVVGINFTGRARGFNTPELLHVEFGESSSGVAGVNGNDVWNDLIVYADSGTRGTIGPWRVAGSAGEEAIVTLSSRGTWGLTIQGTRIMPLENPSGDMMDGDIEGRLDSFPFTVTVSELADDFSSYDVYAYVGDGSGGRSGAVTLNAANGSWTVPYTSKLFNGSFVEATGSNAADYVVFRGVSGDSFTLTGGGVDNSNRTGLHGIEIVDTAKRSTPASADLGASDIGLARKGATALGTIGLNFTGRAGGFNTPELLHVEFGESATGVAGVNGNDVWNDLIVYADSGTRGTIGPWRVAGSAGEEAIVTLSSRGTWGQTVQGKRTVPIEDPSGDMMDGHIEGRLDSFPFTVTVSELADDFPSYDVYAYLGDDVGGRSGAVTLSAANGSWTVPYTSKPFDGSFLEATGSNAADYVVFRGVSGDSFTLTGGGINSSNRTGLRGLEIVGVPEPSTLVLATLGTFGMGLYCWWRRKRR